MELYVKNREEWRTWLENNQFHRFSKAFIDKNDIETVQRINASIFLILLHVFTSIKLK